MSNFDDDVVLAERGESSFKRPEAFRLHDDTGECIRSLLKPRYATSLLNSIKSLLNSTSLNNTVY